MFKRVFGLSAAILFVFILTAPAVKTEANMVSNLFSTVMLSEYYRAADIGEEFQIHAFSVTLDSITWKSSNSKVASVDQFGIVTAKKAGKCKIKAKTKDSYAYCEVVVRKTKVRLNKTKVALYRNDSFVLTADVSSGNEVTWRSSKPSVCDVDENGRLTAVKHGTAIISAKVDGVTKKCTVTVKKPKITTNEKTVTLRVGETHRFKATVSSGNRPEWSVSGSKADITENGLLTAYEKGRVYVYASEDGAKARIVVNIKE